MTKVNHHLFAFALRVAYDLSHTILLSIHRFRRFIFELNDYSLDLETLRI